MSAANRRFEEHHRGRRLECPQPLGCTTRMGYQEEDFVKPMIGVANGHSTITPCNSGLQRLADAAVRER